MNIKNNKMNKFKILYKIIIINIIIIIKIKINKWKKRK